MRNHLLPALFAAALLAASTPAQFSLSTGFTGTTQFDGNYFDVVSITGINVQTMDVHLVAGTHTVEVWAVTGGGTHVGKEANAALWTMVAQVVGLTSNGINVATPLGASLNVVIPPGTTQGFYVTVTTGGDVRYQVGTTIGSIAASDPNMQILEGNYGTYPFSPFATSPRRWNGTIYYNLLSNNAVDLFVQSLTAPVTVPVSAGCTTLSATETVTLQMFNIGTNMIPAGTVIPVSYTVTPNFGLPTTVNENFVTGAPLAQFGTTSYSFGTTVDLSIPGNYTFSASASLPGDMDNSNDAVTNHVVASGGATLITSFPWVENFDGSPSNGTTVAPTGWFNDTMDSGSGTNSDWFFRNTDTASTNTGPVADHTTNVSGVGYYAYVEDAGNFAMVNLRTPCLQIGTMTNPALEFWVHSLNGNAGGASPSMLGIDLIDSFGAITSDITPAIGAIGPNWTRFRVNLASYVGLGIVQIQFRGNSTGTLNIHDICIDDVRVFEEFVTDAAVVSVDSPVTLTNCAPLGMAPVTITVLNDGTLTLPIGTPIPVEYTVNGGAPVSDNVILAANLASGDTVQFTFAVPANLSVQGTYNIVASIGIFDANPVNDIFGGHFVVSGADPSTVISTFPWNENFDGAASNGSLVPPANWIQDAADATGTNSDWFFRNTTTPTTTTGPTSDHTTGTAGVGYYAQVEDAGNFTAVNLITPCIDLTPLANPTLSFWVHSRNGNTGAGFPNFLSIDVIDDMNNLTLDVIPAIGALGTDWNQFFVTLTPYLSVGTGHVRIRFRGMSSGGSTAHDICLDDVQVAEGPLGGTGEDMALRTFINGMGFGLEGNYAVNGGDFMTFNLSSDGGTYWGFAPILAGQLYNDGFPPVGAFPGLHINLAAFVIFNGAVPSSIGLTILGPGGINLSFLTPPGISPFSMRVQGVVPAGMAMNGIFASTDAHVIDFL